MGGNLNFVLVEGDDASAADILVLLNKIMIWLFVLCVCVCVCVCVYVCGLMLTKRHTLSFIPLLLALCPRQGYTAPAAKVGRSREKIARVAFCFYATIPHRQ